MNDDERELRSGEIRLDERAAERPAVVAYDPHFPARPPADEPRAVAYDPHFAQDGASDFE